MYREAGAPSVLSGVPSGPYTGGPHRVDPSRLHATTRQRLATALASGGSSAAFLVRSEADLLDRIPAFVLGAGVTIAAILGVTVFQIGYGDPTSSWRYQPLAVLVLYATIFALGSLAIRGTIHQRTLADGRRFLPGDYLLPLDALTVEPDGRFVVRPLGDVRRARIEGEVLHLAFEDGAELAFPFGRATERMVHGYLARTQKLLEDLSYASMIDRAFAQDPLFDLRADDSWGSVVPAGDRTPAAASALRLAVPALAAVALSAGVYRLRQTWGDEALLAHARADGSPEAYDQYLANGGRLRQQALAERAAWGQVVPPSEREPTPDPALDPGPERRKACLASLRTKANPDHPEVLGIMEAILGSPRIESDHTIAVRFNRKIAAPPPGAPDRVFLEAELDQRENDLIGTFERVFSETCPSTAVNFSGMASLGEPGSLETPSLDVRYALEWVGNPRKVPSADAGHIVVRGMNVAFDVVFRSPDTDARATFHLTMPPAAEPSMRARPRSLFRIEGPPPVDGIFDGRVYSVATARVFDRLYDELFGLFFDGDPRVPLRPDDAPTDPFGGVNSPEPGGSSAARP